MKQRNNFELKLIWHDTSFQERFPLEENCCKNEKNTEILRIFIFLSIRNFVFDSFLQIATQLETLTIYTENREDYPSPRGNKREHPCGIKFYTKN